MAGVAGRSGGANKLSAEEHVFRGTFQPSRHLRPAAPAPAPVSAADRRRTLEGLSGGARRLVSGLLDNYGGFDPASLHTLHSYGLSCQRLHALELADPTPPELYRELRANCLLLRMLNLEAAR
jgi:hypothetical protein